MKAWQVIESPTHWTTDVNARDDNNRAVCPNDPTACKWCGYGALEKVYYGVDGSPEEREEHSKIFLEVHQKVTDLCVSRHKMHLSQVNDKLGHAAILGMFKELDV